VHGLRGIASQQVGSVWSDAVSDGLGSVRGWLNSSQTFVDTIQYDPYGVPDASVGGYGFTGEMTDENGLVYLRARHYDPSIGNFVSLDPFEGFDSSPMSLNGYSWVEGNVANWSDPTGRATYDIWVAAFIEPSMLRFPYGIDPVAIWEGDNRSWFTSMDSIDNPPSSRVWWSIRLDTEMPTQAQTRVGVGETWVVYAGLDRIYESRETASSPENAIVECQNTNDPQISIRIKAYAQNPLSFIAPGIEIEYNINIGNLITTANTPVGFISVDGEIDRYPWHELFILRTDVKPVTSQMSIRKEPSPLAMNPAILLVGAYGFSALTITDPISIDCGQNVLNNFDKPLKEFLKGAC